jgi:hypothetical protein
MNSLSDFFHKQDLIRKYSIRLKTLNRLSLADMIDLAQEVEDILKNQGYRPASSKFQHAASLTLGGGTEECSSLECRLKRVEELARFALMYSDKVYVHNMFGRYSHLDGDMDEEQLRMLLHDDLQVFLKLSSLIESGLVTLFEPPTHICSSCLAENQFGPKASQKLKSERKYLSSNYFGKMTVQLSIDDDGVLNYDCEAPKPFFPHEGMVLSSDSVPDSLAAMPRVMARLMQGELVIASKVLRKKLGLYERFAQDVISNL